MADKYYAVGQGKVYLAVRDANGPAAPFQWIGDADNFAVTGTEENLEFRESWSGLRVKVIDLITATDLSVTMTIRNIDAKNLATAFYGTMSTGTGASVTGEAHSAYVGSPVFLANPGVSAVVATKGVTPLVAGTDYTLDAKYGRLDMIPTSTVITGPGANAITVNYTYASYEGKVEALTAGARNYSIRFEGSSAYDQLPMIATLYNVRLSVPANLEFIGTEVGALELTGGVQIANEVTAVGLSKFMSIIRG